MYVDKSKEQIKVLMLEIFHIKRIYEHYKTDNKDIEIYSSKERAKLNESIESQKVEVTILVKRLLSIGREAQIEDDTRIT